MKKLIYKHRDIKQIDSFKVGEIYRHHIIVYFTIIGDDFYMFLHKATKYNNKDKRCRPYGINLNRTNI